MVMVVVVVHFFGRVVHLFWLCSPFILVKMMRVLLVVMRVAVMVMAMAMVVVVAVAVAVVVEERGARAVGFVAGRAAAAVPTQTGPFWAFF